MALDYFRKHQKKGLAALALMAMIAFTLDLNLFRSQGGGPRQNPVVFELAGKPIRQSDLDELRIQRLRANHFLQSFLGLPNFFGDTTNDSMRDAYVLQREADRMGMPATPEVANTWLGERFRSELTPELFDRIYRENFTEGPLACTDSQLLGDIANQIRLYTLQVLPDSLDSRPADSYLITPLDIYNAYRDESEKVSAYAVPFPVEKFLAQVPEHKPEEISAFYEKYKDVIPDSDQGVTGFKSPRRVKVEYVQLNSNELVNKYRKELTDEELRVHYDESKESFPEPHRELPRTVFAGDSDAKLTPATLEPFLEVRAEVLEALATQRAHDEVERRFSEIRDSLMADFVEGFDEVVERNLEANEKGAAAEPLPKPVGTDGQTLVQTKAKEVGLEYGATPYLSRQEAEKHVPIGGASMGSGGLDRGVSFADHVFDERARLYEAFELSEPLGLRFLGWKLEDVAPEVPKLEAIENQVVQAWKGEQARLIAEREANALAEKARADAGNLKQAAGEKLVLETSAVSKLSSSFAALTQAGLSLPRATDIPEIPGAAVALREALFGLKPGEVVVEPNAAKSQIYVMALRSRMPADLKGLFSPIGSRFAIETRLVAEKTGDRLRDWMSYLRERAGVSPLAADAASGPGPESN
jgi:peptidyl-prolyl cis-trans isomerase D